MLRFVLTSGPDVDHSLFDATFHAGDTPVFSLDSSGAVS
jgi:hypothetical protein